MITSITFDTPIGTEYKRNNRSTRQKSLRCFPTCGIKGHITGGFCGRPLKVVVEIERESSSLNIQVEDYRFIAEIHPVSQPGVSKAKTIKEEDLARQIRSKYDKYEVNGEIFQADSINILQTRGKYVEIELTFNSQHCSWDYSWKSNRWSGPQEQHVVDIIVLKSLNQTEAKIVSFGSSSSFVVSSSHKKPVKAIQIKDEDDDELLCMASTTVTSKGRRSRAPRTNDERSNVATVGTEGGVMMAKLISADSHEFRGSLESSTRQLQISADGKSLSFAPYTGGSSHSGGGVGDQESLNEGANALIMLAVSSGPVGASTVATSKAAKKNKRILANEEATSLKKIKSEAAAPQSEPPVGYPYPPPPHHYQYPPPYGGYPPPGYPPMPPPYGYFPYPPPPYGYPPPEHADSHDASAGKSKTTATKSPYPEPYPLPQAYHHHMYAHMYGYGPPPNQQHQAGTAPPPLPYPPMMFPYPYGGPAAPSTSSKKNRTSSAPAPSPFPPSFDLRHPYPPHHAPVPYPHPPVAVAYPASKLPASAEQDSSSADEAGSGGDVSETEKGSDETPSSPKCTTLVPACGSAEKIKRNRQSSVSLSPTDDDCLPEALPVNEDTDTAITIPFPVKESSITLNKRPTHCIVGAGDVKIREPRKANELSSVFDVIQQRIRDQNGPVTTTSGSSTSSSSDNENI